MMLLRVQNPEMKTNLESCYAGKVPEITKMMTHSWISLLFWIAIKIQFHRCRFVFPNAAKNDANERKIISYFDEIKNMIG